MNKEVKFEEYQDKCCWKKGRWCKPFNTIEFHRVECKSLECPFWCLRNIDRKDRKMSTDPNGMTGRLNLKISKKDFCKYADVCLIDQNLDSNLCIYCKSRVELDVRLLLDIANRERSKE